jgi:hypothetical protein
LTTQISFPENIIDDRNKTLIGSML